MLDPGIFGVGHFSGMGMHTYTYLDVDLYFIVVEAYLLDYFDFSLEKLFEASIGDVE